MDLQYVRISQTLYKFFYEGEMGYGEFYLDIDGQGKATLSGKDNDYQLPLTQAFMKAIYVKSELDKKLEDKLKERSEHNDSHKTIDVGDEDSKSVACLDCPVSYLV